MNLLINKHIEDFTLLNMWGDTLGNKFIGDYTYSVVLENCFNPLYNILICHNLVFNKHSLGEIFNETV